MILQAGAQREPLLLRVLRKWPFIRKERIVPAPHEKHVPPAEFSAHVDRFGVVIRPEGVERERRAHIIVFHDVDRHAHPEKKREGPGISLQISDERFVPPRVTGVDIDLGKKVPAGKRQIAPEVGHRHADAQVVKVGDEQQPGIEGNRRRRFVIDPLADELRRTADREPVGEPAAVRNRNRNIRCGPCLSRSFGTGDGGHVTLPVVHVRHTRTDRVVAVDIHRKPEPAEFRACEPIGVDKCKLAFVRLDHRTRVPVQ